MSNFPIFPYDLTQINLETISKDQASHNFFQTRLTLKQLQKLWKKIPKLINNANFNRKLSQELIELDKQGINDVLHYAPVAKAIESIYQRGDFPDRPTMFIYCFDVLLPLFINQAGVEAGTIIDIKQAKTPTFITKLLTNTMALRDKLPSNCQGLFIRCATLVYTNVFQYGTFSATDCARELLLPFLYICRKLNSIRTDILPELELIKYYERIIIPIIYKLNFNQIIHPMDYWLLLEFKRMLYAEAERIRNIDLQLEQDIGNIFQNWNNIQNPQERARVIPLKNVHNNEYTPMEIHEQSNLWEKLLRIKQESIYSKIELAFDSQRHDNVIPIANFIDDGSGLPQGIPYNIPAHTNVYSDSPINQYQVNLQSKEEYYANLRRKLINKIIKSNHADKYELAIRATYDQSENKEKSFKYLLSRRSIHMLAFFTVLSERGSRGIDSSLSTRLYGIPETFYFYNQLIWQQKLTPEHSEWANIVKEKSSQIKISQPIPMGNIPIPIPQINTNQEYAFPANFNQYTPEQLLFLGIDPNQASNNDRNVKVISEQLSIPNLN